MKSIQIITTFLVLFIIPLLANSQDTIEKITVSGNSVHNLSPNEIVLKIAYQEYFTGKEETIEQKVKIEDIEKRVLNALKQAKVKSDQVTMGGVNVVRPYQNGNHLKRRLNKSLFVCVKNIDEYICVTRHLEKENLFDDVITEFNIAEYKHTDKETYLTKSRSLAFDDAKEKALLILSNSGQKLGKVLAIKEMNFNLPVFSSSLYEVERNDLTVSGFKPIVVSYTIEVTFEILD